jgi:hypothetical protein
VRIPFSPGGPLSGSKPSAERCHRERSVLQLAHGSWWGRVQAGPTHLLGGVGAVRLARST